MIREVEGPCVVMSPGGEDDKDRVRMGDKKTQPAAGRLCCPAPNSPTQAKSRLEWATGPTTRQLVALNFATIAVMSSLLFLKTESPNTIHDCGQQSLARQVPMLLKRFNQAALAKFLSLLVTGFGDAIGVKRKHVPGRKLLLPHRAIPLSEQSEQRAGGLEPIHLAVASYQQTDKWPQLT